MVRPHLELETWGKIRRTTINGKPTAFAYYRDSDGVTRLMQRAGKSPAEAERNLIKALKKRLAPASEDLTPDSTVEQLAEKWLDSKTKLADGSRRIYRNAITGHITPGLGSIRLREITVPRLDRFISTTATSSGLGTATTAHVVLRGMFTLAARHGAVRPNPMTDVPGPEKPKRTKKPASPKPEQIRGIRARFEQWDAGTEHRPDGDPRRRRPRASDLLDTADMMIGTGMRTGEVFALQWEQLDLEQQTVTITRTIAQSEDGRFFVQNFPKSEAGERVLQLPEHVVDMLLRRRVASYSMFVFPSSVGTFRHPNNYRTVWRAALADTEWKGLTPRSFRKTVATVVRDELGITAARDQLGHESERTTGIYTDDQLHTGPDARQVLAKLFA